MKTLLDKQNGCWEQFRKFMGSRVDENIYQKRRREKLEAIQAERELLRELRSRFPDVSPDEELEMQRLERSLTAYDAFMSKKYKKDQQMWDKSFERQKQREQEEREKREQFEHQLQEHEEQKRKEREREQADEAQRNIAMEREAQQLQQEQQLTEQLEEMRTRRLERFGDI